MNETNFCYWLQGYFEITAHGNLSEAQINVIKEHLQTVFNKTTLLTVDSLSDLNKPTIIC